MKRFLIASLSTLVLAAAAPAHSEEVAVTSQTMNRNLVEITPFNLVQHGYQGYFKEQGIPSNGAFDTAVNAGEIKAIDLVKSGIARGRLSQETLNDKGYLHAVQTQLDNLNRN
jgi:hypothetical protein